MTEPFLFTVPTGESIDLEPFHYAIIGQTQFSGKCLSGDDEIVCANGHILSVREAFERKLKPDVISLSMDLRLEHDRIVSVQSNGMRRLLELKTDDGSTVKLTANHPLLTPLGWMPVAKLKVGDWIGLPRELPVEGDVDLDDATVKIIAYMLSEGTLYKSGSPRFTNSDPRLVRDLDESLAEHGLRLKLVDKASIDYRLVQLNPWVRPFQNRGYWWHFCRRTGLRLTKSADKEIPPIIFRLGKQKVALFLNRYMAGDGMAYFRKIGGDLHPIVGYCSTSNKVLRGLRLLLLRFGIKTRHVKPYEIYIATGDDIIKFITEIGGFGKEGILQDIRTFLESKTVLARFDRIPLDIPVYRRHYSGNGYSPNRFYVDGTRFNQNRITVQRVAKLSNRSELQLISESHVWWRRITAIEELTEEETFDVQVEKNGNLVVNGILVHNTTLIKRLAQWASENGFTVLVWDTKETEADYEGFGQEVPVCLRESTDSFVLIGLLESMFRRRLTPYYATLSRITEGAKGFDDIIGRAKETEARTKSAWLKDACRVLYDLLERLEAETSKVRTVPQLQLRPGLNRMVINQFSLEAQQLIVKNSFEDALRIYKRNLILILDEAFKFLPQGYSSPATRAVMQVITQGAKTGLYVWIGTQYLAETDKGPLKACAFKFLGTQDHSTEVKHTLDLVPEYRGRFNGDDVMRLKLGHWILVRKRPLDVRTVYLRPLGVPEDVAMNVAVGRLTPEEVRDGFLKGRMSTEQEGVDESEVLLRIERLEKEVRELWRG